jgi:subtilisin family serine protease
MTTILKKPNVKLILKTKIITIDRTTIMLKKTVGVFAGFAILTSLFSYKEVSAQSNRIYNDVAEAPGPVRFKFTLNTAIPYIKANQAHASNYQGQDAYIVIIDTGIEAAHPFFGGRVALEACFAIRCPNGQKSMIGKGAAAPVHMHGTHVAGIAAGSNSQFTGVAPKANIIAINVFDSAGAYDTDIIKALNWVSTISSDYNIVSVNMSLGGSQIFRSTCDGYIPEMTDAIRVLREKNIATVIASGNSYAYGMSAPACISYAVSVAATFSNKDEVTTFSNVNELTTMAAPGNAINSSALMGSYRTASGTSMASPFVAGAFAVYYSKFGKQTVSKVISDFASFAPKATDAYTGIKVNRLDFNNLFGNGTPVVTTTTTAPSPTTTTPSPTTTVPVTTTTVSPSPTTTVVPSPTTTLPPPQFHPTFTRPILLDLYGGYTSSVYVKYRVPAVGRNIVKHYNLYCDGKDVYTIPQQTTYSIVTYRLAVPAKNINYCHITATSIYGKETYPSSLVRIYPRNK